MLVLTPPPHLTECVSGYLHRLSMVNGYSNPTWIIEPYRYASGPSAMGTVPPCGWSESTCTCPTST